jgi:predicted ATPase
MITELRIENFRGFASLDLKNLKRVNLVVGENNAGKTSLLEAILLLCEPQRVQQLPGLFRALQGNPDVRYFRWLLKDGASGGQGLLSVKAGAENWAIHLSTPKVPDSAMTNRPAGQYIHHGASFRMWGEPRARRACRIISVQHRDPNSLVALVGKAHRKAGGEEALQRLLAKVDPRINKVRVDPGEDGNQVIVDIGLSELLPVSQVGQGVYRLLAILADIIGENPDVVLIDEVENGLHHSIHKQVWAGLAETAEKLDVQIIATTHSGECLHAAHYAFADRKEYDLSVIQLFRIETGVQGRVLDGEHIEAAIAGKIDLR